MAALIVITKKELNAFMKKVEFINRHINFSILFISKSSKSIKFSNVILI